MMRGDAIRVVWAAALAATVTSASLVLAGEPGAGTDARVAAARSAVKALGGGLKEQLMSAIGSGGPVAAIETCRVMAPSIAAEQSRVHALEVGRTALKVRNPANAPDAFEAAVLEDFVKKLENGADPATLEHWETVDTPDGGSLFRYMKAIPMAAEPCSVCHGTEIGQAVAAEIKRRYPEDRATGFKAGELRGAFTVKQKIK